MLMAWLLERTAIPARRWIAALILVPMTIPSLLSAIAWIQLLDPRIGLVNVVLRSVLGLSGDTGPFDIYSLYGMCFVQGLRLVPSAFLMIAASFRAMDPSLEEQSAMAGRGVAQTTLAHYAADHAPGAARHADLLHYRRHRILRHSRAARLYRAHSRVEHGDLLGDPLGSRFARLWLGLGFGGDGLGRGAAAHVDLSALDGASGKIRHDHGQGIPAAANQSRRLDGPATALCVFYVALAVVLPFLMLIWTSVQPFYAIPSADSLARVSFEGYVKIWQDSSVMRALWNTTVLALVTSAATILLAVLVSWFVVRRGKAADGLSHYLATVSFLPQCVPSIVIGLAFIFVYVRFPIPIYGTLWIIALAMTTRYLAYSSRTMTSALMQVHGELEEASQMSRAPWARTLRRITMPLLAPAMINVFFWVAVHAMQELSMALMLYNPETVVVSTMIWSMWQNGRTADAAVLGVILIVLSAILLLGGQLFAYLRRDPA